MQKTVLYIIKPEKYFENLITVLKAVMKDKNIIYVTTNKPYNHLVNTLNQHKIRQDKIFFIDCISSNVRGDDKERDNCIFVGSPQDLVAIGIAIDESTKHVSGKKVLFLDSLSTLLIYNDATTIAKFSNFVINKMRSLDVDSAMFVLESDVEKDTIKRIESVVDEVKSYGG